VALFLTLSVTIVVVLVFASMIAWALSAIAEWLINNVQRFQSLYIQVTAWLEEHGIFVAGVLAERFDAMWLVRLFQEIAGRLNRLAGFAILVFIFLMMGLLEADAFQKRIASLDKGRGAKLIQAGSEIAAKFRRYMLVRTLLSVLTGLGHLGFRSARRPQARRGVGIARLRLELHPIHRAVCGHPPSRPVRAGTVGLMADDHNRFPRPDGHPVHDRKLSRAACRRRRSGHFAVRGRLRGVLLGFSLGHSRRLYRRAHHDHHHYLVRAVSLQPMGRDTLVEFAT
jgi:hypothetical protein